MFLKPDRIYLKVCCIASLVEAETAIACGADAIGLVSEMPSGPGCIPDDLIIDIAASVRPPTETFLLTCRTALDDIINHLETCRPTTVQLVDEVDNAVYPNIRKALPNINIIQVLHIQDESSVDEAKQLAPFVDALLLDSGNPNLETKVLGGTGRVHNWDISHRIVQSVNVPVFLAGGITPDNVAEAMRRVGPFGIDLCTGVRTQGHLDSSKLKQLVRAMSVSNESL